MSNDKKLTRSADNRWVAGVCGGLGAYFNIDPTLIRVIFVQIIDEDETIIIVTEEEWREVGRLQVQFIIDEETN